MHVCQKCNAQTLESGGQLAQVDARARELQPARLNEGGIDSQTCGRHACGDQPVSLVHSERESKAYAEAGIVYSAQNLSNAALISAEIASGVRPSMSRRSIMNTSLPSLSMAMDGDEAG